MLNIKLYSLIISFCFVKCDVSPNFVLFLTDDQDLLLNGLLPMKKTLKLIGNEGKFFTNSFANSPICCPSRATILTGKYQHNTNVKNNSITGNCNSEYWQNTHEPFNIAAILKNEKGYTNFYAGKYLNMYGDTKVGGTKHIPKGFDWWMALKGNSKYFKYYLSINGTKQYFENQYLTDLMRDYALDFLNQHYIKSSPFFMTLATPNCHAPFTPADRHKDKFLNEKVVKTPAFNHTPFDKHWIVRMTPDHLPKNIDILNTIQKRRLQSLLSVDEMVQTVVKKLKQLHILDRTYLIFTSDNGYHIGQFAQPFDKRQPYESDIRVPFLIRGPKIQKKTISNYPVSFVDLLPTILDLGDIKIPENLAVDGKSFKSQLFEKSEEKTFKRNIFIEYYGEGDGKGIDSNCHLSYDHNLAQCTENSWCKCQDSRNNTYTCVLKLSNVKMFKYCKFDDAKEFVEVYDLKKDPYELKNIYKNLTVEDIKYYNNLLNKFKKCKGNACEIK